MLSVITFLAVLSVLVLVHEFGHFIVAKKNGIRVEKFSFGFGPKLFGIKKGDTEYLVSAIPMGGYIKMAGDEPGENLKNERWEFLSRSVFVRFQVIVAGPVLNYILAFLLFSVIFMYGSPTLTTDVGGLLKDYPAEKSGILAGDTILTVNGTPVNYWEDMTAAIRAHRDGPLQLTIERAGVVIEKEVTPKVRMTKDIFGMETRIALVGISPSQRIENVRYGFFDAMWMGGRKLLQLTGMTYKAIWLMLIGRLSLKESVTGPIGIFVITGQAAKMGFVYILHLMGILSASLAIFNLLPIPVLDGGHIIFLALEKLRGKPLSMKAQETIANVGITLLIMLTIFIFYSDIIKFGLVGKTMKLFGR